MRRYGLGPASSHRGATDRHRAGPPLLRRGGWWLVTGLLTQAAAVGHESGTTPGVDMAMHRTPITGSGLACLASLLIFSRSAAVDALMLRTAVVAPPPAADEPVGLVNITVYRVSPLTYPGLDNMDTGDPSGDVGFGMWEIMMPMDCRSSAQHNNIGCGGTTAGTGTGKYIKPGDPTNVYEEFTVEVNSLFGEYNDCNPILDGPQVIMAFNCLPLLELTYVLWLSIVYLYWNLPMFWHRLAFSSASPATTTTIASARGTLASTGKSSGATASTGPSTPLLRSTPV